VGNWIIPKRIVDKRYRSQASNLLSGISIIIVSLADRGKGDNQYYSVQSGEKVKEVKSP